MNIDSNKYVTLNPEKWIQNHGDLLYKFAFSRVKSKKLAEDLIQDTFISALKSIDNFKGSSSESTWLISILKNKIIDHYRKNATKNEISISEDAYSSENNKEHWRKNSLQELPDTTEETLDVDLFNIQFNKCISKLSVKNRSVFTLKHIDGESTEELCEKLNISSSNYWVIIHRAKSFLRKCLQQFGFGNWQK